MPTIKEARVITHPRRIASFADLHNVRTGLHGATGLGVDIDETLAATQPCKPAYLPVNRL